MWAIPPRYYTGVVSDVSRRQVEHNAGNCIPTAKYRPWAFALECRRRLSRRTDLFFLFASASLELICRISKKYVEAGERSVAAAYVALQLQLDVGGEIGGIHLLFERAQTISHHHNLVKERLDRPGFL